MKNFYEQVYEVVRRIPRGQVTSYGRVASMLGRPNAARAVGYALSALKDKVDHGVPWQRVINSQGRISIINQEHSVNEQAELLRTEGVAVNDKLQVDFERYLWAGLHFVDVDDIVGRNE
ncbi:MAG: methylated-DNA--[protein]-cysteine S-methyltransferase [Chloroflexi bacterium]|nr:methylated-DNA--[protein]-cysteine S-methyltransferase [Chloroflexota bacterium]MBP8054313.1 methylated-DNA--[protein]-cysteine S-methyltransferase [Chloroflexota bacterium]